VVAVGQTLSGKYELRRLIGDGGMGSVYEAEHVKLGTKVAIKVLHADLARRPGLIERFLREARVAAQIKSPHVVQVTDVDQTPEGVAYLVMELLEGEPLSRTLEREGKLQVPLASEYARQILEALEAAHALGVIHRDLKPENVFITFVAGKPVLKLIDFGIAKLRRTDMGGANLTVAGVMMGTAEYMAPEQAFSADRVDARADLYSVGVMLYELVAGVRPVSGEDARVIAVKVERGEITPLVHAAPDVPREIAGLVHRAMAHNPDLRFASATEMRLALEGALAGRRPPTTPIGARTPEPAGTGTVMGAPAEAALKATPSPPSPANPLGSTVRAAPVGMGAGAAPAYAPRAPYGSQGEYDEPPRRRFPVWLVVLPLLLGAGGVAAYLVVQQQGGSGAGTNGTATATMTATATTTTTTTTPPTTTPATATGKLSPLTPATITTPTATARPTASTSATGTATASPTGSATADPTAPPTVGPIVIPGITNDAGLITVPTTFPSGFQLPFPVPPPAPTP
jgi:serine/threonine-protein kinase